MSVINDAFLDKNCFNVKFGRYNRKKKNLKSVYMANILKMLFCFSWFTYLLTTSSASQIFLLTNWVTAAIV